MSTPRGGTTAPGRPSRTQKLDQGLVERYRADPKAFQRGTDRNLLVAVGLLGLGGGLDFVGVHTVGVSAGGLALATMGLFPVLLGLAALDEVRWRRALVARRGVPPPPPPTFKAILGILRGRPKKTKMLKELKSPDAKAS